jgi:hypothetical protein
MSIWKKIIQSIYNPVFYSDLISYSYGSAIKYYLLLTLLLLALQVILNGIPLIQNTNEFLYKVSQQVVQQYPDKLKIQIKKGVVSTNVKEPYFIPLPPVLQDNNNSKNIVIDTQTPFSQSKFEKYKAFALLTRDSLFLKQNSGQTRAADLSKINNFTLDKNSLRELITNTKPWFKFVAPILILFSATMLYIIYLVKLIYMFILAFMIWLLLKLFSVKLTYGQSYKVGLHAITLSLILDVIIQLIYPWLHFQGFPFMATIITLVIVGINFYSKPSSSNPKVNIK